MDYSHAAAGATWRVTFALLIPLVLYVIYYRIWVLNELTALKKAKANANVEGVIKTSTCLIPCLLTCSKCKGCTA